MEVVIIYIGIVNLMGFFIMGWDKAKARAKAWRISEKTLFLVALMGGSLGMWIGMEFFRHKTKHWYFKYGIPVICLVQIVVVYFFLRCEKYHEILDFLYTK